MIKAYVCVVIVLIREQDRVSITPSPIDDFLGHPAKSEIPAWKSANQELAGVLKNLRKMEHHLHGESMLGADFLPFQLSLC